MENWTWSCSHSRDRPVSYASRAMTDAQKRYAVIEKELLAVVLGCERFHQYIYGKEILVESDHKPLENICHRPLCQAPPRLQRMLLRLQKYDIKLVYKSGKKMFLADTVSRAHLSETAEEIEEEEMVAYIHMIYQSRSVSDERIDEIKRETDKKIQKLHSDWMATQEKTVPLPIRCYWSYREEMSEINGLIFKGERIVIPTSLQKKILSKVH